MAEGEFALAQQHLEAALEKISRANPDGGQDMYAMLADAAGQQRLQADLLKYAPLAEETATRIGHKLRMATAHRAWGVAHTLAAEYSQADTRFQQALEIFAAYPAPWQIGRTLFEMGELARLQGKMEQARDCFSRALRMFDELRAAPYAAQTRAALENLSRG